MTGIAIAALFAVLLAMLGREVAFWIREREPEHDEHEQGGIGA